MGLYSSAVIKYQIDSSGLPTYLQLIRQTLHAMVLGKLRAGDRLPTAGDVVRRTGVNPNTVLKAYRELAREGLVDPSPGRGTFITKNLGRPETAQHSEVGSELGRIVQRAGQSGMSRLEVEAIVGAWLDQQYNVASTSGQTKAQ